MLPNNLWLMSNSDINVVYLIESVAVKKYLLCLKKRKKSWTKEFAWVPQ